MTETIEQIVRTRVGRYRAALEQSRKFTSHADSCFSRAGKPCSCGFDAHATKVGQLLADRSAAESQIEAPYLSPLAALEHRWENQAKDSLSNVLIDNAWILRRHADELAPIRLQVEQEREALKEQVRLLIAELPDSETGLMPPSKAELLAQITRLEGELATAQRQTDEARKQRDAHEELEGIHCPEGQSWVATLLACRRERDEAQEIANKARHGLNTEDRLIVESWRKEQA